MQNSPQPATGGPDAKRKLSTGCIVGIVVAVVLVLAAVLIVAASGAGLYWFSRQAANVNAGLAASRGATAGRSRAGGTTAGARADGADAAVPTAAQTAAVAGGQAVAWEQQEISWTAPRRWAKREAGSQTLLWRSPGGFDAASLIGNVSPMGADFPAEVSINAFYRQAQTRKSNGGVNEVRWLTLDGVRGVMFRESAPEDDDSSRRPQWVAYRDYKGQQQLVNIMLASRGKDFARHEDALFGVLYSTKLTK